MIDAVVRTSGEDIAQLVAALRQEAEWLRSTSTAELVQALHRFSVLMTRTPEVAGIDGGAFLALWLREQNLNRLLDTSLGSAAALDGFVDIAGGRLRAQPAGLVCHWVAGNVPTLPFISWVFGLLAKNVSLLRISRETIDATERLLRIFARTAPIGDRHLLDTVRFIHFDGADQVQHQVMSMAADGRVIWGGHDAVDQIGRTPRRPHCHDVVFGPKYSIGVIDAATCGDAAALKQAVIAFVRDVVAFDQRACSSPQTIFVEGDRATGERVLEAFAAELEQAAKTSPKLGIDSYTAVRIFRARASWGLHPARSFRSDSGAGWTVCLDEELSLKEAVQSRTVFVTAVADLMSVPSILNAQVQTVGMAVVAEDRMLAFADAATARGVSRCVRPGRMNAYDVPWDGRMVLGDLVRWVSVKW